MVHGKGDSLEVQFVELKGEMRAHHAATTERLSGIEQKLEEGNERFREVGSAMRDIRDRIDGSIRSHDDRLATADTRLSVLANKVEHQESDLIELRKQADKSQKDTNARINSLYKWIATLSVSLAGALVKILWDVLTAK